MPEIDSKNVVENVIHYIDVRIPDGDFPIAKRKHRTNGCVNFSSFNEISIIAFTLAKLADTINVRSEDDIDEMADKVAKKFVEVIVNMG